MSIVNRTFYLGKNAVSESIIWEAWEEVRDRQVSGLHVVLEVINSQFVGSF